jgi:hypothetical protein
LESDVESRVEIQVLSFTGGYPGGSFGSVALWNKWRHKGQHTSSFDVTKVDHHHGGEAVQYDACPDNAIGKFSHSRGRYQHTPIGEPACAPTLRRRIGTGRWFLHGGDRDRGLHALGRERLEVGSDHHGGFHQ